MAGFRFTDELELPCPPEASSTVNGEAFGIFFRILAIVEGPIVTDPSAANDEPLMMSIPPSSS